MKVAFFMINQLEYGGGAEKYYIETASTLTKYYNFQADIVTFDDNLSAHVGKLLSLYYFKNFTTKAVALKEKTSVIKQAIYPAKYYKCRSLNHLRQTLNKYDVVYAKNEILEAVILKVTGYQTLPPILFGCHTTLHYPRPKSMYAKIHNLLYEGAIYRFLAKEVKFFHVLNGADEDRLRRIFPLHTVIKIYNPFNSEAFIQKAEKYQYDFSWDASKYNILWVGRLTEQKGVSDLTTLINDINKSSVYRDKVIWNIVGDGKDRDKILTLKESWDNINYFGYVENNYLASMYRANDLFISTSHWEGFPYTILEALTMNLPVIAFDIPGINDIIEPTRNGILVSDLSSFISQLMQCLDKPYHFTHVSQSLKGKFNHKRIYDQLAHVLNKAGNKLDYPSYKEQL